MSKKPELIHSLVIKSINVPPSINGKEKHFFMRRNKVFVFALKSENTNFCDNMNIELCGTLI